VRKKEIFEFHGFATESNLSVMKNAQRHFGSMVSRTAVKQNQPPEKSDGITIE
jgi:hypothetical protein